MDNYNWFPPYITSLLMWEGTNSKKIVNNINENYLGGHKVRVKKIQEIIVKKELINYDISENNHSTLEILDLSFKKNIIIFINYYTSNSIKLFSYTN